MSNKATGYMIFIAALGMMFTLLAGDVAHLEKWRDAIDPAFVAGMLTHLGAVIAAFVGGKLLPGPSEPSK
jgi:hypothetical protein